jgi:hypothetical protein
MKRQRHELLILESGNMEIQVLMMKMRIKEEDLLRGGAKFSFKSATLPKVPRERENTNTCGIQKSFFVLFS